MYLTNCPAYNPAPITVTSAVTIPISRQAQVMDAVTEWMAIYTSYPFIACTNTYAAASPNSDGTDKNIYIGGDKPSSVYPATGNLMLTENGVTHYVFTTAQLEQLGLGYVVKWTVTGSGGQWVTPPANWSTYMPPASTGTPFWKTQDGIYYHPGGNTGQNNTFWLPPLGSLEDWYTNISSRPYALYGIMFSPIILVKYVLIKNLASIQGRHSLNPVTKSTTLQLELLKARQPTWNSTVSQVPVTQTVTVILPPTGTCTTPPATETTVNFGTVYPDSFPNNSGGVAAGSERDFLLRFRNCPRTNISYSRMALAVNRTISR